MISNSALCDLFKFRMFSKTFRNPRDIFLSRFLQKTIITFKIRFITHSIITVCFVTFALCHHSWNLSVDFTPIAKRYFIISDKFSEMNHKQSQVQKTQPLRCKQTSKNNNKIVHRNRSVQLTQPSMFKQSAQTSIVY